MKRVSRPNRASSQSKKPTFAKKSSQAGQIRIIGGKWRGRKLPVLDAEGLRPTTDRNKETLFNWLMGDVQDAQCLDVFAGSGGLGLEALSRYAQSCVFIELDKLNAQQLEKNISTLAVNDANVKCGDAFNELQGLAGQTFDIVFVDPPFHKGLIAPTISALINHNLVTSGSLVYIEHERELATTLLPDNWLVIKEKQTQSLLYKLIKVS